MGHLLQLMRNLLIVLSWRRLRVFEVSHGGRQDSIKRKMRGSNDCPLEGEKMKLCDALEMRFLRGIAVPFEDLGTPQIRRPQVRGHPSYHVVYWGSTGLDHPWIFKGRCERNLGRKLLPGVRMRDGGNQQRADENPEHGRKFILRSR
jgi:hypothetical protein